MRPVCFWWRCLSNNQTGCIYKKAVAQSLRLSIINSVHQDAGIAQLVEHNLAKVTVASSILVSRSKWYDNKAVM